MRNRFTGKDDSGQYMIHLVKGKVCGMLSVDIVISVSLSS